MKIRILEDEQFLLDIGHIEALQGMSFIGETCSVKGHGYTEKKLSLPELCCKNSHGDNVVFSAVRGRNEVFRYSFFKNPEIGNSFRMGFLYPTGMKADILYAVRLLYGSDEGFKQFINKKEIFPTYIDYTIPVDKTDLKGKLAEFEKNKVDIVFCITDNDSIYNPIKQILAEMSIPSQMLNSNTAYELAKIYHEQRKRGSKPTIAAADYKNKYIAYNLLLQICAKLGGIPYILKDMPGDVDCFVGLDVGTVEAGLHYPAGSVSFGKNGELLGYYQTPRAQKGEKITEEILEDIFSNVLSAFDRKYGRYPKHIVIHRDGFSRERDSWYKEYFAKHGVKYSIFEIKKYVSVRLAEITENKKVVLNPPIGACAIKEKTAILVTTKAYNDYGAPRPVRIEKVVGDIDIETAAKQVLYLAQIHAGALNITRLPITTLYADKVCKFGSKVPARGLEHRLFFL